MFEEFDGRKGAKGRAEFITPKPLRDFIATYVKGTNLNILEPAIGSGQMLESIADRVKHIDGYDIAHEVREALEANFGARCAFHNESFISSKIDGKYDYAISNYPYSLKFTDNPQDAEAVLFDEFMKQFYPNKKATGVMDFAFILKSFNLASEGIYLCFPGIGYRTAEKKFREYLIANNYLVEYGILEAAGFEHTAIDILFMQLSKHKDPAIPVKSFRRNLQTSEVLSADVTAFDDNYTLQLPAKQEPDKYADFDSVSVERSARLDVERYVKRQIGFSQAIWGVDASLHEQLPLVKEWIENMIEMLQAEAEKLIE